MVCIPEHGVSIRMADIDAAVDACDPDNECSEFADEPRIAELQSRTARWAPFLTGLADPVNQKK
jgi:hypothetical protein